MIPTLRPSQVHALAELTARVEAAGGTVEACPAPVALGENKTLVPTVSVTLPVTDWHAGCQHCGRAIRRGDHGTWIDCESDGDVCGVRTAPGQENHPHDPVPDSLVRGTQTELRQAPTYRQAAAALLEWVADVLQESQP